MQLHEAINKRILDLCEERNLSVNKLSTTCGITQSTLNNISTGASTNPTVGTIKKICDGLGITLKDFFDDEVFLKLYPQVE